MLAQVERARTKAELNFVSVVAKNKGGCQVLTLAKGSSSTNEKITLHFYSIQKRTELGVVFTTLHFLRNLQMGAIS